ncbi:iron-sulfur cluster carrier protein ApbC [Thalassomonas viridans]|uniref:iron-sulfur cluster carrier protein ApbC n=1 Tax=Thalassomonas viridans TaxID=137584 RepID=UPI0007C75CD2|nr:iron-sulfur cluster carrier protein ApbC [Thalassomonas viridans]
MLNSDEIKQLIEDTLTGYRSDIFPEGILPLCTGFSLAREGKEITVGLTVPFPCSFELAQVADKLSEALQANVTFDIQLQIQPVRSHDIANVGNIIAIASGKGGVGKSTTTVNLAYALMAEGAKVGILDADIYGPSIPTMLGLKNEKPTSKDGKLMTPLDAQGLDAMSIGFLVPDEEATVWRGPMASSAFNQLLNETDWSDLDYLLIDMPPGTGDIQLTLAQKVPVAAAVVVTTPQDIALADAAKGIIMFDKVQVPVLGVVENMSYHLCQHCGEKSHLFGQGGGEDIAANYQTRLLGQLPLDIAIRQDADLGKSEIIENSAGEIALLYRKIARNMAAQLFYQLDSRSPDTAEIITR